MKYPNAFHGVKKIFTAQLLQLIGMVCLLAAAVLGVTAVAAGLVAGSEGGVIAAGAGTAVFAIAGVVLPLIGYIMNLVGLSQAAKDEECFRIAFWCAIFILVITIVNTICTVFNWYSSMDNVSRTVGNVMEIIIIVYVVAGISNLAGQLGRPEMIDLGTRIMILIIVMNGLAIIADLIPLIFGFNETTGSIASVMMIIAAICGIVEYIAYLVYLGRAKSMLEAATVQ